MYSSQDPLFFFVLCPVLTTHIVPNRTCNPAKTHLQNTKRHDQNAKILRSYVVNNGYRYGEEGTRLAWYLDTGHAQNRI